MPETLTVDDAIAVLIEFARNPHDDNYATYGYEIWIPNVLAHHVRQLNPTTHPSQAHDSPQARALSPIFYEAAWELCRRGIFRPGIRNSSAQAVADGGNGYSVTALGRRWISQASPIDLVILHPTRLHQIFSSFGKHFGPGFVQRATEAAQCHATGSYLASCAMCGAAAESILLSVAIAKTGDENATVAKYRASNGRQKTIDRVVGSTRQAIGGPFKSAMQLLSYWRDEAAHGSASTISEIEAHDALARLLRLAQFISDNWDQLIRN